MNKLLLSSLSKLRLGIEPFTPNSTSFQSVRWTRKPIWMGTAKGKLFKVPPRQKLPKEEYDEIKRLFNNYRTQMKSINRFLTLKYNESLQAKADTELEKKLFEEDLAKCRMMNNQWNAEVKIYRERRVAEELAEEIAFAKLRVKEEEKILKDQLANAEKIVRREKETIAQIITPENLDKAIEDALANPVDYNFAIDVEGNKYIGRESGPQNSFPENRANIKQ